jgi:hypothetical protein
MLLQKVHLSTFVSISFVLKGCSVQQPVLSAFIFIPLWFVTDVCVVFKHEAEPTECLAFFKRDTTDVFNFIMVILIMCPL